MKVKTLIIIPLILAAVAYLGAKGYIYYKVKAGLDKMIEVAAPFVQIDYSGIGSSLNGTISVDKVRMTPTGTYDEISIQRIDVRGDGPKFLLDLAQGFDRGEPPEQMAVAIHQLESPISSSFLSSISNPLNKSGRKTTVETCSIAGILYSVGLKELGFPFLSINGDMDYKHDKAASAVEFKLNYDLAGVESSFLSLKMNGVSAAGIMGLGKPPVLEELHFVRQIEPGYMKQIVTLCSGNSGQTHASFIDGLFSQPDKHYLKTLGFIPGPGLSKMFKQLITNAGQLDIRATPSSEISPAMLSAYKPEDLVYLLGVSVKYNDTPVTDLSYSVESNKTKTKANSSSKEISSPTSATIVSSGTSQTIVPKSRPRLRYIETDISNLPNYLNYRVRIYTLDNDKPKQGLLVSIKNQTINVEQQLYSGKMTVHLHLSRLAKIEVLRKEQ